MSLKSRPTRSASKTSEKQTQKSLLHVTC
jgi:hypothetical protein